MRDRRQNFSDTSSVVILICLVTMSLLANVFFKGETAADNSINEIRFPAYETEYEQVNSAMPFVVNMTMPDGWSLSMDGDADKFPQVNLHNPYYIYSGEECIGYIAFNIFTPPADDTDIMTYHQHVWPAMDNGRMEISNYTIVRLTEKFEAGYCKLSDLETTADAVLCFNKDIHNMAGIVLAENVADEELLKQICLSLSFSAM